MLVTTNAVEVGEARVRTTFMLERVVRASIVERVGLAFDARFAAAMPPGPGALGTLYLVTAGRFETPDGAVHEAPVAFALADDELERVTDRARGFRVYGHDAGHAAPASPRADSIELRFHPNARFAARGIAAGPVALPTACWEAAAAVVAKPGDVAALVALVEALAAAGVISTDLARDIVPVESERFARIWSVFEMLYREYVGSTSLKMIAARLGMSVRQVSRDAEELAETFALHGGYRDTLFALRLRLATLLLSADASVGDVAKRVGYGGAIAMARAFRDAGLPAPKAVQVAIAREA